MSVNVEVSKAELGLWASEAAWLAGWLSIGKENDPAYEKATKLTMRIQAMMEESDGSNG
jgi:hypothetical protein